MYTARDRNSLSALTDAESPTSSDRLYYINHYTIEKAFFWYHSNRKVFKDLLPRVSRVLLFASWMEKVIKLIQVAPYRPNKKTKHRRYDNVMTKSAKIYTVIKNVVH